MRYTPFIVSVDIIRKTQDGLKQHGSHHFYLNKVVSASYICGYLSYVLSEEQKEVIAIPTYFKRDEYDRLCLRFSLEVNHEVLVDKVEALVVKMGEVAKGFDKYLETNGYVSLLNHLTEVGEKQTLKALTSKSNYPIRTIQFSLLRKVPFPKFDMEIVAREGLDKLRELETNEDFWLSILNFAFEMKVLKVDNGEKIYQYQVQILMQASELVEESITDFYFNYFEEMANRGC